MAAVKAIQKETTEVVAVQIDIEFEQLLKMVKQLPEEKRIEFLDTLQAQLEEEKLIKPRTDEDQRRHYIPEPKPDRPSCKKPKVTRELIKQWEESEDEGEELDANLTDRELLEMIKNI